MPTLQASFLSVAGRSSTGATLQACDLSGATRLAALTTSGSSALVQATGGGNWTAPRAGVVMLTTDAAVNVNAGTGTPVASATAGVYLAAGLPYFFTVDKNDRLAAITA